VIKYHCSILAVGALRRAIREYFKSRGVIPEWLPRELSREEKQAIEAERMLEQLYKKYGFTSK